MAGALAELSFYHIVWVCNLKRPYLSFYFLYSLILSLLSACLLSLAKTGKQKKKEKQLLHSKPNCIHHNNRVIVVQRFRAHCLTHDILISEHKSLFTPAWKNRVLASLRQSVWRLFCWSWTCMIVCHPLQACFVFWPTECWCDLNRAVWSLKIFFFI